MSLPLVELLRQTLSPQEARQAEQSLLNAEKDEGFAGSLLNIICDAKYDLAIRQAGSLFFKNYIKRNWSLESSTSDVAEADKLLIKQRIIPAMTALPTALQLQLGEAITIIADRDFPKSWPNLVDELVNNLSPTDMAFTNGVLQTAHSIFKRWRAQYRSDALFTEIAFVLQRFCEPFLALFKQVDLLIHENSQNLQALNVLFETLVLLTKVFYDLNSQDIPEFFEDHMNEFMHVLHKYLNYDNSILEASEDDDIAGPLLRTKASICEIAELYTQRYEEVFAMLPSFVDSTWNLLTRITAELKYDLLVVKALSFLSCVVKIPRHAALFQSQEVLQQVVENIVLPNMSLRSCDEELFEDDPVEYTRRDLEGGDNDTRRRSAAEFVRILVEQFEQQMTSLVMSYAARYLEQYNQDPINKWAAKDTAIYLVTSVAIKGVVTKHGVSSTNLTIDIVQIFSESLLPDLLASDELHPILKLDAIKFALIFRNQLTQQQLMESFPLLVKHLKHNNSVVSTYAAITLEALLSLKRGSLLVINRQSVVFVAEELIGSLLQIIENGNTPEKLAENDFLMRCLMRVILALEEDSRPFGTMILQHLNSILAQVSRNPSNPQFNHYLFECYGAIFRCDVRKTEANLTEFEATSLGPLLGLLQNDVTEFVPYVFQLLAALVESRGKGDLPSAYIDLLPPLLTPALWDARGNVPALVRLLQAFLRQEMSIKHAQNSLEPLLGIFQKLLSSKANDNFGFDLLETIYTCVPPAALINYHQTIFIVLLTRLNTGNTEKFTLRFVVFIFYLSALEAVAGPDFVITTMNKIQPGYLSSRSCIDLADILRIFVDVFKSFILPNAQKIIQPVDAKTTSLGLSNFATKSRTMQTDYFSHLWLSIIIHEIKFLELPAQGVPEDDLFSVDGEEMAFQASFVRLRTASRLTRDHWPQYPDPKAAFVSDLQAIIRQDSKYSEELRKLPESEQALLTGYGLSL